MIFTMFGCSTSARNRRSASAAAIASSSPVLSRPLSTTQRSETLRSLARKIQPIPPWATGPTTSYWPPTKSPAPSFGSNENGAPHLRQNPEVRPGEPSRPRPTGSSQREQNRRLSGTMGLASTASEGSRDGTGGTSTRPAPSRLAPLVCVRDEPPRRDEPEAADGTVLRALAGGVVALGSSPVAPVTGAPTAGPFDAATPSVAPAAG